MYSAKTPMMSRYNRYTALFLLPTLLALSSQAQTPLPSLGDRISGTVSLEQEYEMGQQFLSQIRRSALTIPDALLNDYLENLTYKLASRSQLQDHRLSFIIIDSEELNAFAAPGGIIGVNTGLFLNAQTEAEFASVMAHEIAHVSQRHFARGVDEAQAGRVPQLATLLASVLVMATSQAEHGMAAITATQGRAVENQLRFSRSHEAEADRIGQDNMYYSGFDPDAMGKLFERLIALNRFGRRPPEFLLSHPLTESRVADARGRAMRYPPSDYANNLEYQTMRARILSHYAPDRRALIMEYQEKLNESTNEFAQDANRYGLAVSYSEDEQYARANTTLAPLLLKDPNRISYVVTQAEIYTAQNEPHQAINFLRRHLEINPDNHSLTMAYVAALQESRAYTEAAEMMERYTQFRANDHHLWFQLAETWGQAGNIGKVHQARAEYFMLLHDFRRAREQLQFAVRVETDNGAAPAELARLRQKINNVEEIIRELSDD
ncbi:MAG TPA: peptidase M48 [Gammaproteobacteria bacterium]|nr:peptidase M48 [Gammaproteobacteria bacterium]